MLELDIIVVGAGLCGLSSAIALSRAGHNVRIIEKSSFKRAEGFMISLQAPGTQVLETLGCDFRRARSTDCDVIKVCDAQTLKQTMSMNTREFSKRPNNQIRSFYRPDLHDELKRVALLKSDRWTTPSLKLGSQVVSVDIQNATILLKDGSSISSDVIIAADGQRSLVRSAFTSMDPLTQIRIRTARAIIPTEALLDDPETRDVYYSTKKSLSVFTGPDHRSIVYYEGRDGLLQDFECNYPIVDGAELSAEKNDIEAKKKIIQKFEDFHPGIVKALRQAERITDWELWEGNGVDHMHEGKILLVGDAAHAMLPFTGNGASQGIEDAGALGVLFRDVESKDEIIPRLKLVESLRRQRNAIFQSLAGVPMGSEAKIAEENPEHLINQTNIRSTKSHFEYMADYDVLLESEKMLAEFQKQKSALA